MVFSSLIFIFAFLPIALLCYYGYIGIAGKRMTGVSLVLTVLSLLFYLWGSGKFILLLLISILANWLLGESIQRVANGTLRKKILGIGIVANLSGLLYFKYSRFLLDTIAMVIHRPIAEDFHTSLPVGISFYTFMAISYLVEVYRSSNNKASLLQFSTYISLFPHLVAGPIVRFNEIASDLKSPQSLGSSNFYKGILRFAQGLGMKVLIADNLAPTADRIFSLSDAQLSGVVAWLGAIAYTFQIYFDFAGYSAMAIGLALMFGFHFPENFNRPYLAASITNFWQRWHMSLSFWLRDYLYIPLGGNRKGDLRTYFNLFAVFFVCGLWHGAAWTFVVWGIYHGMLLIIERVLKKRYGYEGRGFSGVTLTFILTVIGWVIFRCESLEKTVVFFNAMSSKVGPNGFIEDLTNLGYFIDPIFLVSLAAAICFSFIPFGDSVQKARAVEKRFMLRESVAAVLLLVLGTMFLVNNSYKPFIYFRF